uniref:Uncharacterized protein n=1 Tax=Strombidium inclinatum TaxID=197538 RepID=A0A7S3IG98_9SPIT
MVRVVSSRQRLFDDLHEVVLLLCVLEVVFLKCWGFLRVTSVFWDVDGLEELIFVGASLCLRDYLKYRRDEDLCFLDYHRETKEIFAARPLLWVDLEEDLDQVGKIL